jgi:serine/threonine-protein kinase
MEKSTSISDILAEISELHISNVAEFLDLNYDLTESQKNTIKEIVVIDQNQDLIDITGMVSDVASMVIYDYTPEFYINKTFGDFVSKKLIYHNDKSMLFVGSPKSNSYEHNVAIKVISPTHQHVAGYEHLAMQAQYMANIKHANIVEINSAGTTEDGTHYLVMEYLSGMSISKHCIHYSLNIEQRLSLFLKVCSGISQMHSKLIIHSDIKPANIVMDVNNNPKVIDFDLSQSNSAALHQNFNYKNLKGYTATYAAPEQLLDKPEITIRTDVFGLGAVLFEMLTGYPYSQKSLPTLNCIEKSMGKVKRRHELAFIIDLTQSEKVSNRHAGVNELMEDISDIIYSSRISNSYKNKSSLAYRVKLFILRNKYFLATAIGISIASVMSINEIITERDNVKRSLKMIMKSNDPREFTNNILFEKFANESYVKTNLNSIEYYNELMGWGDSYYGKGMSEKAVKFFQKAQAIFADPMSNERITATSRLLQSYYSLGLSHLYRPLVKPYLSEIQSGEISNPYLIELYLVMSEVESRYNGTTVFGEMKQTASELLSNLNLDEVKEKKLRDKLMITILIGKGISHYYSLPHDHVSTRSYISENEYLTNIKPALLSSKSDFDAALSIIRNEKIQTHLEPTIYLWIAFIYAELEDFSASETYRTLALNKTLSIFDEYHPTVTTIYLKSFAMHRYINPEKAVIFAQLSFDSYKQRKLKEQDLQIMTWVYLVIAHFNNGDYKKGLQEMTAFREEHKNFTVSTKFIASFISSAGFHVASFSYLEMPAIEEVITFTANLEYELYELGSRHVDFLWSELIKARNKDDKEDYANRIAVYSDYVQHSDEIDNDTKVTENLFLLSSCNETINCDPKFYADKIEQDMSWSSLDDKMSVEKLGVFLQLSRYYIHSGQYKKADSYLSEIETIVQKQTFEYSFHKSMFFKLKAALAYAWKDTVNGEKYKSLAMPGALYNFGPNAKFTKELINLN